MEKEIQGGSFILSYLWSLEILCYKQAYPSLRAFTLVYAKYLLHYSTRTYFSSLANHFTHIRFSILNSISFKYSFFHFSLFPPISSLFLNPKNPHFTVFSIFREHCSKILFWLMFWLSNVGICLGLL